MSITIIQRRSAEFRAEKIQTSARRNIFRQIHNGRKFKNPQLVNGQNKIYDFLYVCQDNQQRQVKMNCCKTSFLSSAGSYNQTRINNLFVRLKIIPYQNYRGEAPHNLNEMLKNRDFGKGAIRYRVLIFFRKRPLKGMFRKHNRKFLRK